MPEDEIPQLKAEIARLQEELVATKQQQKDFLHEIRVPLHFIWVCGELLEEDPDLTPEKHQKYVAYIREYVEKIQQICETRREKLIEVS